MNGLLSDRRSKLTCIYAAAADDDDDAESMINYPHH